MPTERYCEGVQVREIEFSAQEIIQILLENFKLRADQSYDFDYDNPMVLHGTDKSIKLRFIQQVITQQTVPMGKLQFKPLPTQQQMKQISQQDQVRKIDI